MYGILPKWLQYTPLQGTFIVCPLPKEVASLLNQTHLYKGEFWFRKNNFSFLTVVTIRMSMTPDPSVVGGGWQ
jgi:hypothetical protein